MKVYYITENDCYKAGRSIEPKGIMIHSTAVNQTDPTVFIKSWDRHGAYKCVHAFVGQDETYQTLPWTMRGWHAGGDANNTHIGIEICEDDRTNATYFKTVYTNTVALCSLLCKKFRLNPLTDIIDHAEGYQQGIASNHADVTHWFPLFGANMDIFRKSVKEEMEREMTKEEAKTLVQEKAGLADSTLQYLADDYRWGDELIIKLAKAMNGGA